MLCDSLLYEQWHFPLQSEQRYVGQQLSFSDERYLMLPGRADMQFLRFRRRSSGCLVEAILPALRCLRQGAAHHPRRDHSWASGERSPGHRAANL